MVYADYSYYTDSYLLGRKAAIDAASFPYYARQASIEIDSMTFGRAADIEPVKMACCELAELMCEYCEVKQNKGIAGETVKGYSVSYREWSDAQYAAEIGSIIRKHLTDTGLLYCGVM